MPGGLVICPQKIRHNSCVFSFIASLARLNLVGSSIQNIALNAPFKAAKAGFQTLRKRVLQQAWQAPFKVDAPPFL
jgi:hypothetical protein